MASIRQTATTSKTVSSVIEAIIYTRVSKDEMAKEGLSLDAQLDDCRRYAIARGWVIGAEYQDVLSGKRDDRPHYQRMLADIRQLRAEGRQAVIVVKWLHRLGRRVLERVRSREEMKAIGVTLHSVAEGGEVSDLVANILASVAEEEVRQLSERVQSVNQHLARIGWARPGRATWGYRWRPPTEEERANGSPKAVLDVDALTAPYVQEAYQRAAAGESIRKVQHWIVSLPSVVRGNHFLSHPAVKQVLTSPTYIGCTKLDGELLPGRWPALIDRATWDRVQERISDHVHRPHQASNRYLATGFIRCPRCGARMRGTTQTNRTLLYRCEGQRSGRPASVDSNCTYSVPRAKIDTDILRQVVAIVEVLTTRDEDFRMRLRRAWRQLQQPTVKSDLAHRVRELERERDKARERLRGAALKFVDGDLDRAGYDLARETAQADLEAADAELGRVQVVAPLTKLPPLDEALRDLGDWAQILGAADIAAKRDVLAFLIDYVTPVRVGYGKYDLQITWMPLGHALRTVAANMEAN